MLKSPLDAAIASGGRDPPAAVLILTQDEDIEAICRLVHAGQAKAVMQVVVDPRGGMPKPGLVVSEITPSGWMALQAGAVKDGSGVVR